MFEAPVWDPGAGASGIMLGSGVVGKAVGSAACGAVCVCAVWLGRAYCRTSAYLQATTAGLGLMGIPRAIPILVVVSLAGRGRAGLVWVCGCAGGYGRWVGALQTFLNHPAINCYVPIRPTFFLFDMPQQSQGSSIVLTKKSCTMRPMWPVWNPSRASWGHWHLPRLHRSCSSAPLMHYMPERLM